MTKLEKIKENLTDISEFAEYWEKNIPWQPPRGDERKKLFGRCDYNGNGYISFTEMIENQIPIINKFEGIEKYPDVVARLNNKIIMGFLPKNCKLNLLSI